jgi:hypothetical protein
VDKHKRCCNVAGVATVSGLNDMDYPSANGLVSGLSNVKHVTTTNKVPLPPEVMEHFGRILFLHSDMFCLSSSALVYHRITRHWFPDSLKSIKLYVLLWERPNVTNFC